MAHVELSLTELTEPFVTPARHDQDTGGTLRRWYAAVHGATEPSLVIDARETVIGISASCCELLGLAHPEVAEGRSLLDGVRLVDFTKDGGELTEPEVANIPPLLAVTSGRLARGLLRVHRFGLPASTVDAIATPLRDGDVVVGSLTFFAPV